MKSFKWIYKPSGNCPVQAEFWFLYKYYYFRARWNKATLTQFDNYEDFDNPYSFSEKGKEIILYTCKAPHAGWLRKSFCYLLIFWGCIIFSIKLDKLFK